MADVTQRRGERAAQREPARADAAREWLETMMLIRRFEERAGEMYAKAKVGGFLHLAIGEEATIVGAVRAMRDERLPDLDLPLARPRARARHRAATRSWPSCSAATTACSRGRGGSMHMFDLERRFMGGYGIVGGNLPLAAGHRAVLRLPRHRRGRRCACSATAPSNQGTFGETLNLAALWKLPVVFMVTNNQFGMGTALERHSAVDRPAPRAARASACPGMRCDGMDVARHLRRDRARRCERAREERQPVLVEAITYRFRGHSMADPEEYRTKEQVEEWRKRDPIDDVRASGSSTRACSSEDERERDRRRRRSSASTRRSRSPTRSPFPPPESLYDDVYVLGDQVQRLVLGRRALGRRAPRRGRARAASAEDA